MVTLDMIGVGFAVTDLLVVMSMLAHTAWALVCMVVLILFIVIPFRSVAFHSTGAFFLVSPY